ncbi:MAG: hypothetical protein IPH93_00645 [Saprospiraceae bacterium]|nr:hypothetical protein [Saprospiraceae bacterium]MBK7810020.1 hypothetical protein [Saprospiraceae bacterium]MBK9629621.1 hypothetical protein [Saprospiraceae bacterium]
MKFNYSLLYFLAIMVVGYVNPLYAQQKEITFLKVAPKGTQIKNGMLVATDGYKFVEKEDHIALIPTGPRSGGATSTFICSCQLGGGSCEIELLSNGVRCTQVNCDGQCVLYVKSGSAAKMMAIKLIK